MAAQKQNKAKSNRIIKVVFWPNLHVVRGHIVIRGPWGSNRRNEVGLNNISIDIIGSTSNILKCRQCWWTDSRLPLLCPIVWNTDKLFDNLLSVYTKATSRPSLAKLHRLMHLDWAGRIVIVLFYRKWHKMSYVPIFFLYANVIDKFMNNQNMSFL